MVYFELCPVCGKADVTGNRNRDTARCEACGFESLTSEELHSFDLSLARTTDYRTFCRELASSPPFPWVQEVFDDWPSPIAHEYYRLRKLLEDGEIIGAIWQLKDFAEVLIKFPTIIMARDIISNSANEHLTNSVRRSLLSKPPSMGDWFTLGSDTPADVYFGRGQAILKQRERIKRKTMETRRLQYRKYAA